MINPTKLFFISLYLNGYQYKIFMTEPFEMFDLLKFFHYRKELIIVEHNGKINNASPISPHLIKQDDKIEIITIVGGG
uniref:hypothetical protein n=1 Tax=Analipus japonicus TaxID=31333 RepID=UPI002E794D71|nr:hypothetical protein V2471_pgp005 [Analipus japonicus]WAM61992.1 hypothetical protein [Analipus japonicus]